MKRIEEYINRVEAAIDAALNKRTKLTPSQFNLEGMSGDKNKIFLNELIKSGDRYLEIGVWKGSTFISALYDNNPEYKVAIDNFSQFEGEKQKFFSNCKENNINDYVFINSDCFNLVQDEKRYISNMNVYFYDGDHREIDQELALTYYIDHLSDEFIFIVDDWNYGPAQTGTRNGIEKTGIKVHKEWEFHTTTNGDKDGWWNGIYVAVCGKENNQNNLLGKLFK